MSHAPKSSALIELARQLGKQANYQTVLEWQYYHERRQLIELNLRPLFKALTFQADRKGHALLEAVAFLKKIFAQNKAITKMPSLELPKRAVPKKFKDIIFDGHERVKPCHCDGNADGQYAY